jgi:diaminopimelate epimerase
MNFNKYHALGNDYIVIDPLRTGVKGLSTNEVQKICDRNFGVGSDGILFGPFSKEAFELKIFNPDGSEAEKSGNGVRIFSRYLKDAGYVNGSFELKTLGGQVSVEFLPSGLIRVDMGEVKFESKDFPPIRELTLSGKTYPVTCVSVGNPHCVLPMNEISPKLARELGPWVENNRLFPHRINMQLLKVLDRKTIQIEIWERGAGYTLASGSSSCAAASAAHRLGLVDRAVTVRMPGGALTIDLKEDGHVLMTGPVTKVAVGEIDREILG